MTEYYFRVGTIRDADTIFNVIRQAFGRAMLSKRKIKRFLKQTKSGCLVAVNGKEQIIGTIIYQNKIHRQMQIDCLAVLPKEQNHQIGQGLLRRVIKLAQNKAKRRIVLQVRTSNYAQRLYIDNGFLATSFRRFYYRHPLENAIIMTRNLQ